MSGDGRAVRVAGRSFLLLPVVMCLALAGAVAAGCGEAAGGGGAEEGLAGAGGVAGSGGTGAGGASGSGGTGRGGSGGSGSGGSGGSGGPGGSGGTGGAGGSGGAGSGGAGSGGAGSGGSGGIADPGAPLVPGLSVSAISLTQAVEISLVADGGLLASRAAPVVAGRPARFLAYLARSGSFVPGPVTAELLLDGAVAARVEADVRADGDPADPRTAVALAVDAGVLTPSSRFALRVVRAGSPAIPDGARSPARFPADGSLASLDARSDLGGIRVVLVPLRWDADGSSRLPDTGPVALDTYRAVVGALYPISAVELVVHAPVPYDTGLNWRGNVDFGDVNDLLYDLRGTEQPGPDVYYFALIRPADTFSDYCGGSCVTGQSYAIDDVEDDDLRVGGGVAFEPEDAAYTLAHELGHLHGRYHAPCGTSGDDLYPYADATLGSWGWDRRDDTLLDPDAHTDFMAYCDSQWVSDYTYEALFERVEALNTLAGRQALPGISRREALRFVHADLGEAPRLGRAVRGPPIGAGVPVRYLDVAGRTGRTAWARPLANPHGGRSWLLPESPAGTTAIAIDDSAAPVLLPVR